jgi:hypothetical protein
VAWGERIWQENQLNRFRYFPTEAKVWLEALETSNRSGEPLPSQYLCPSGMDLSIGRLFEYEDLSSPERLNQSVQVIRTTLLAMKELGFLKTPTSIELWFNYYPSTEPSYSWEISSEAFGTISIISEANMVERLTRFPLESKEKLLQMIESGVVFANNALSDLEFNSLLYIAQTTDNPNLLLVLASDGDKGIRDAVVANPHCPKEGKALAALHV